MQLELARHNYLRPNGLGGYIVRQSDLSSWARCGLQKFYYDRAAADPDAPQGKRLSATIFGSVVHYAAMVMEQRVHEGDPEALAVGIATFEHYWHPANTAEICEGPPQEWLPNQTYGGLRERGRSVLKTYYQMLLDDESTLLALEYQFVVPVEIDGTVHTLTGTIDRLSLRRYNRKPYIGVDDLKTGKRPWHLRYNTQGTAYAWATTLPQFWSGWPDSGMEELDTFDPSVIGQLEESFSSWGYRLHTGSHGDLPVASRRFRWFDLQDLKFADGGWRSARDAARLHLAIDGYVRACEAGAYFVTTTGEICRYCPFRTTCGGPGLPPDDAGRP